jgi:hypothetical protein
MFVSGFLPLLDVLDALLVLNRELAFGQQERGGDYRRMRGQELRYLDLFCCLLLWANFVSLYSPLEFFFRKKNSTMRSHSFIAFSGLNYQVFINF